MTEDLKFKRSDFYLIATENKAAYIPDWAEEAAEQANAILADKLAKCPRVVCRMDDGKWSCDEHTGFARITHIAYLVGIREIKEGEP